MPDWSMMKIQTKKQYNRSSRIAGGWTKGWQPAPENNMLWNLKKQKPDCPKGDELRNELRIWELARGMYCEAKKMGERYCRSTARNRDGGQKLLRKALAQSGLLCQWLFLLAEFSIIVPVLGYYISSLFKCYTVVIFKMCGQTDWVSQLVNTIKVPSTV